MKQNAYTFLIFWLQAVVGVVGFSTNAHLQNNVFIRHYGITQRPQASTRTVLNVNKVVAQAQSIMHDSEETMAANIEIENDDDTKANKNRLNKILLQIDGLEPYVLVSAITATASFEVLTQGNFFDDGSINFSLQNFDWLKVILLASSTTSSFLGIYALGVFSFTIIYAKAALARDDIDNMDIYDQFFDSTAKFRYNAFVSFYRSLILFVVNLFLFAISYIPEDVQLGAAVVLAGVVFFCWRDWQDIADAASIIYQPPSSSTETQSNRNITNDNTTGFE